MRNIVVVLEYGCLCCSCWWWGEGEGGGVGWWSGRGWVEFWGGMFVFEDYGDDVICVWYDFFCLIDYECVCF